MRVVGTPRSHRSLSSRAGSVTRTLLCSAVAALLFHPIVLEAQQEWDAAPGGVVAARSEAQCAASHASTGPRPALRMRCHQCGEHGRPGRQDPGGDCVACCNEMKEARQSTAIEAGGDNIGGESDGVQDGTLADCCEGQCCEPYEEPSKENPTGRYMCVATKTRLSLLKQ